MGLPENTQAARALTSRHHVGPQSSPTTPRVLLELVACRTFPELETRGLAYAGSIYLRSGMDVELRYPGCCKLLRHFFSLHLLPLRHLFDLGLHSSLFAYIDTLDSTLSSN